MARPKKLVVVVERDHTALSVLMFVLSCKGFRVAGVHTREEAHEFMATINADVVLFNSPTDEFINMGSMPFVVRRVEWTTEDLILALHINSTRKRGPKPGTPRVRHYATPHNSG